MTRTTLAIEGMHCGHCVSAVRGALSATPGVHVEDVQIGRATIELDDEQTSLGEVLDALDEVGYEGREAAPEQR
jgi:copper chaperone